MKFYLLGLVIAMLSVATHASPPSKAKSTSDKDDLTYCEKTVIAHGMLSRAQFECGYSQYNNELIQDSAKCFKDELGDKYGMEILKYGMTGFDHHVKELGKKGACSFFLKKFPDYVRK